MAQEHKGERWLVQTRLDIEVFQQLVIAADDAGTSHSQYVADVLAMHFGRPDLVRALGKKKPANPQGVLPLAV